MVREFNVVLDRDSGKCRLKEVARYDYGEGTVRCSEPDDVFKLLDCTVHLTTLAEEYFYVICLNTCNEVLGISRISHGTVGFAIFTPREVYQTRPFHKFFILAKEGEILDNDRN
jgi:DNA repair protein RadC